jgi:hypothetical protein
MRVLSKWNRRRFLQAAGIGASASALLPFIPTLGASAGGAPARRIVLFTAPLGSRLDEWRRNGAGDAFVHNGALPAWLDSRILAPLDGLQPHLAILDGLDIEVAQTAGRKDGNYYTTGEHEANPSIWTGSTAVALGEVEPSETGVVVTDLGCSQPSLDQILASRMRTGGGPSASYQLAAFEPFPGDENGTTYAASFGEPVDGISRPMFPQADPREAFRTMFADAGMVEPDDRSFERRRSVLSLVEGEMARLRAELPREDRERLEQHHQSIRDLEARLASGGVACERPAEPEVQDWSWRRLHVRENAQTMFQLIRLAFECDLTRCVSFLGGVEIDGGNPRGWDHSLEERYTEEDYGGMHQLSHEQNDDPRLRDAIVAFARAQVACFGDLVRELQSGAGTFDDTLVVWGSCMSDSDIHSTRNPMFMIAAGERTPIATNRYHKWGEYADPTSELWWQYQGGVPHNRLLTTLASAMGHPDIATVGDATVPEYSWPSGFTGRNRDVDHRVLPELLR